MNLRFRVVTAIFVTASVMGSGAACSPASPGGPIAPIIVESPPDAGVAAKPIVVEDPAPPAQPEPPPMTFAERALRGWTKTNLCPKTYDYFPRGGLQIFWCHRPESLTFAALREAAGGKIFVSGPHTADDLVLDSRFDYGHYDPAFVKWVGDQLPEKSTPETQALYDRNMKYLARVVWKVLGKTKSDKVCFNKERSTYADLIAKKKLPEGYYERWFYFMNPAFCTHPPKGPADNYLMNNGFDGGVDGNVAKSAVGFWLRRSMDGTYDAFAANLEKIMKVFDPSAFAGKDDSPKSRKGDVGY